MKRKKEQAMINTALFKSLERQARLLAVAANLGVLTITLDCNQRPALSEIIWTAINRERDFMENNIDSWLESFGEKL